MVLNEHVDIKQLGKEMDDPATWNPVLYKADKNGERIQIADLGQATWRVIYNDGKAVDGPKGYADLARKNVKSISVIDVNKKVLHTIDVKKDKFIIRLISLTMNFARPGKIDRELGQRVGNHGFTNPKRCFLLATPGEHCYVWDDGDIDQLDEWGDHTPYTAAKVGVLVKGEPKVEDL